MIALLRTSLFWAARHIVIFMMVALALLAVSKIYEAYQSLPALERDVAALEAQQAKLDESVAHQLSRARASAHQIEEMEVPHLEQRLAQVKAELAAADQERFSQADFALEVVRGDTTAIARELSTGFYLQLLRKEEAALDARLRVIQQGAHAQSIAGTIVRLDARAVALETKIAQIESRHPILSRAENIPLLQRLRGPWQELSAARKELRGVNARRNQLKEAQQVAETTLRSLTSTYQRQRAAMLEVLPPGPILQKAIEQKRAELSQHWGTRAWNAVKPVVSGALWITLLVIVVPPATKAFWFFVVAPAASRLRPIIIRPDLCGDVTWLRALPGEDDLPPGSGVSRRLALEPGDELIIKPEYLQSSMNEASIDSTLVLSWALPLGSLATGLIGLTRIRVHKREFATVSATRDMFDEIGVIHIPAGAGLIFKPRNLVGVIQRTECPLRIRSVWRLGHLSAWLTLQFRFLVFEGPCALVVKGARGVVIEPAVNGRRIAGAATLGWTAGLRYSVRRSETFLAYLMGKHSLFNDSFEGTEGKVVYEEVPRAGTKAGILGRGLEGLGDGLLKIVGL